MYADAIHSRSDGSTRIATFFLVLIALVVGYEVVFAGGPVAQSHGDLRLHALIGILPAGVVGVLYCTRIKGGGGPRSRSVLERLVLLLPVYVLFQVTPLPLQVVRV